jgi:hypothetical protein
MADQHMCGCSAFERRGQQTSRVKGSIQRSADVEDETLAARRLHLDAVAADLVGTAVDGQCDIAQTVASAAFFELANQQLAIDLLNDAGGGKANRLGASFAMAA